MMEVGVVVGVHGLKGELKFQHWCDDCSTISQVSKLFDKDGKAFTLTKIKPHKNIALLKLDEINTVDDAMRLRGEVFRVLKSELGTLPDGVYYLKDLLGIKGHSSDGQSIGKLTDWLEIGARKIYVFVDDEGKQSLIPANPFFVKNIDLHDGIMTLNLIEGLIE
ncbi:MAG: ribosome maturation factor RimM [Clostridiales bacterium]|nr:ribosome maturation factor RimM [Clostridiales bacterium]